MFFTPFPDRPCAPVLSLKNIYLPEVVGLIPDSLHFCWSLALPLVLELAMCSPTVLSLEPYYLLSPLLSSLSLPFSGGQGFLPGLIAAVLSDPRAVCGNSR